jgi:hypothetical protein
VKAGGPGMPHPVRCAITANSAHTVRRGSVMAARCAARTCPRVHGSAAQSGPQVALRRVMTGSGRPPARRRIHLAQRH